VRSSCDVVRNCCISLCSVGMISSHNSLSFRLRGSIKDHVLSGDLRDTRIRWVSPPKVGYFDVILVPLRKVVIYSFFCKLTYGQGLKEPS
jgi:hypothetical protein